MIPCLIKDSMQKRIKAAETEMEESKDSICVHYKFDLGISTVWIYYDLLRVFTKTFFVKGGGNFDLAFCQKIEKRRLGKSVGSREL